MDKKRPRVTVARVYVVLALAATSALLLLPGLLMSAPLSGDGRVHVLWQAHFAEMVRSGQFYPRWLPEMNNGFGSPAFFFYPPLLQWVASAFIPFLPSPEHATDRLIVALWALSAAGGFGCWAWLRALGLTSRVALFGALIFLLMPYRCFVDVYQRGAVSEMAGICVIPWLLCCATRLKARRRGSWSGYALSCGALLLSNIPIAEIGLLFVAAYVLAIAGRNDWRFLVMMGLATTLGFMVAATNVATMLGDFHLLTDTVDLWSVRNRPTSWLLFSSTPWVDPSVHRMTMGLVFAGLFAGAILFAVAAPMKSPLLRRVSIFLFGAIVLSALLNMAITRPFWALNTPLSRIQFPFRLLTVHVLSLSGLAALAAHRLKCSDAHRAELVRTLMWLAIPGLLVSDAAFLAIQVRHHVSDQRPTNTVVIASSIDANEYVLGDLSLLNQSFGDAQTFTVTGTAQSHLLKKGYRYTALAVQANTPSTLALHDFAFTGWECRIDRGNWTLASTMAYPLTIPSCAVPSGTHLLEARLPAQPIEKVANLVTVLALLVAIGNLVTRLGYRRSDARQPAA